MPDDLRDIGALNTSCGGARSNGSRTSLRNLVVLEGTEFTRAFLEAANRGAQRLGWKMSPSPFLAELEWLDLVGEKAAGLLEDRDKPLHLLDSINAAFFSAIKLHPFQRDEMLMPLTAEVKERFERAEKNDPYQADGHYARIYLFVMGHPALEILQTADHTDMVALRNRRIEEIARAIKTGLPPRNRLSFLNRLRDRKNIH